jgi:hypothetical protein
MADDDSRRNNSRKNAATCAAQPALIDGEIGVVLACSCTQRLPHLN